MFKIKFLIPAFCLALIFLNSRTGLAYDFEAQSGLGSTKTQIGYDDIDNNWAGKISALIFPFLGIAYLTLMIYAGILWMTAQGGKDQIEKAKKIIVASTIGLLIILSAYAISYLIVSTFQQGTVTPDL